MDWGFEPCTESDGIIAALFTFDVFLRRRFTISPFFRFPEFMVWCFGFRSLILGGVS